MIAKENSTENWIRFLQTTIKNIKGLYKINQRFNYNLNIKNQKY